MANDSPPAALAEVIATEPPRPAPEDKLTRIRLRVAQLRDMEQQKQDTEERLKTLNKGIMELSQKTLPDMFDDAKIGGIILEAEGNQPAWEAKLNPYYHANIAADWDDDRREAAFKWLDDNGHGDLAAHTITIYLPRKTEKVAAKVMTALAKLGVDFRRERAVPWNTLTAFIKEQVEVQKTTPPLGLLGAAVGRVVKLKPEKEKR